MGNKSSKENGAISDNSAQTATQAADQGNSQPSSQPVASAATSSGVGVTEKVPVQSGGDLAPPEEKESRTRSAILGSIDDDPVMGKALRKIPVLRNLNTAERNKLGGALIIREYKMGDVLFRQGDEPDGFYIIQKGKIDVILEKWAEDEKADAKEHTIISQSTIATLTATDYFGETSLLRSVPRGATLKACEDCVCYYLDNEKFEAIFQGDPSRYHGFRVNFVTRRVGISAEKGMWAGVTDLKEAAQKVAMTQETRQLIFKSILENMLFADLDDDHKMQIVDEMAMKTYSAGERAIAQGEPGTNFYSIESGSFDIKVHNRDIGKEIKVATRGAGESFGELALMYNAPRAADVIATTDAVCWVIDRYTFRRIAQDLGEKRLKQYHDFMRRVELLCNLAEYERVKIAEALEEVSYDANSVIFRQGEVGDAMYIVANGEVVCEKQEGDQKNIVKHCKIGDCFGERALIKNEARAATVRTIGRTHLLKLDAAASELLLGPLSDEMLKRVESYDKPPEPEPEEKIQNFLRTDIPFDELENCGTLGKGSFGHVKLVKWRDESFALKAVSKKQIVDTRQQGHILSEKRALQMLSHPFIIKLYATYKDADRLYFLLEPSLGGELFTVLRKKKIFDGPTARFYAASVILAFEYMHSFNTVYRDLKPENLLLDEFGYIKVTDFGFAKKIKTKTWTLCGTPEYLAPEIVAGKGHGKGVDWWTIGILIFEMLASYTPFYNEDHMQMYGKIAKGKIRFPSFFENHAKNLIRSLLNIYPTKRLGVIQGGAQRIKDHVWFNGFDFEALFQRKMEAPIIPTITSKFKTDNFDNYGREEDVVEPYVDDGTNWDAEF